jgi:hypothetical protein
MPEGCIDIRPSDKGGRRECRVQAAPMARLQQKSRRQSPQVRPEQPGIPCTMVYGLFRALPGVPGLIASVPPGLSAFVAIGQTPLQVEAGRVDQTIYF